MLTRDLKKIEELLTPRVRERYGLAAVMRRWERLTRDAMRPQRRTVPTREEEETIRWLMGNAVDVQAGADSDKRSRGRPRNDDGRFAACLLALIFYEYTGRKPTRITIAGKTNTSDRDKSSPFYQFAIASFNAIGVQVRDDAIRYATEQWGLRNSEKRTMRNFLFGPFTAG